jgi:Ring finger domain
MDRESLREILRLQFDDIDMDNINEAYYDIGYEYYDDHQTVPNVEYILNTYQGRLAGNNTTEEDDDNEDEPNNNNNDNDDDEEEYLGATVTEPMTQRQSNIIQPLLERLIGSHSDEQLIVGQRIGGIMGTNLENIFMAIRPIQVIQPVMVDVKTVLDVTEIKKLTLVSINKENKSDHKDCIGCFANFVESDIVRILPCNHKFHRSCIDTYLATKSYMCPSCEQPASEKTVRI